MFFYMVIKRKIYCPINDTINNKVYVKQIYKIDRLLEENTEIQTYIMNTSTN